MMTQKPLEDSLLTSISNFQAMLEKLEIDERKRFLWKEIYSNALHDRNISSTMYASCSEMVFKDPTQHAIHGPNIAKYIEKMSKANDQLLKLAELIAKAAEAVVDDDEEPMTTEEIYKALAEGSDKKKKAR